MTHHSTRWTQRLTVAAVFAATLLSAHDARSLAIVPGSTAGAIAFAVQPFAGVSGVLDAPSFAPSGALLSPGAGYPIAGVPLAPAEIFIAGIAGAPLTAVANPANIAAGFGAAAASVVAAGGPGTAGGVFWPFFFAFDDPTDAAITSNVSAGVASLTNTFGVALPVSPGGFLGVRMIVPIGSPAGAFVAASLTGTIQINLGPILPVEIVMASDGVGPLPNFVLAGGVPLLLPEAPVVDGFGIDLVGAGVLLPGDVVNLSGTLTILADPMAGAVLFDLRPEDRALIPPDFVGYRGRIPEPGAAWLLAFALLALAAARQRALSFTR